MRKRLFVGIIAAVGVFLAATVSPAAETDGPGPELEDSSNLAAPPPKPMAEDTPEDSPVNVKSGQDQTTLSLETDTLVSPYLGAVKKKERPDYIPRHSDGETNTPLDNYNLETGVGLKINERTQLNLGYRFKNSRELLDSPLDDTLRENGGDVRFSLEIKLPF